MFAFVHASAQKTVFALTKIRTELILLANFCMIVLKPGGEVVPGVSLVAEVGSGKSAQNQAKATLRKAHGAKKNFGLAFGIAKSDWQGKVTFHLLKQQNVQDEELRRGLKKLGNNNRDLSFLKTAEASTGQTREQLLGEMRAQSGQLGAAQIAALLSEAGMESEDEHSR